MSGVQHPGSSPDFSRRGVNFVDELAEIPDGAVTVFSAHGVSPAVRAEAGQRRLRTIDATCPLVAKVHQEARRYSRDNVEIILIGHPDHEEVQGTFGHARQRTHIVDSIAAADAVVVGNPQRLAWLSQTTLAVDDVLAIVARLRQRFPTLVDPPSEDICYASQNRQRAVQRLAQQCDLVLIVGSPNSSNSVRLVEVALAAGVPRAYLLDDPDALPDEWLTGASVVGVGAGASVPNDVTERALSRLAALGYSDVEEPSVAREQVHFRTPDVTVKS